MPEVCLINGRTRPVRAANISIDDWAFRYGWGLFETIRIRKNCPLFLDRHLSRLCGAAPLLDLGEDSEVERSIWRRQIVRAAELSSMQNGMLNCYWTRGSPPSGINSSRIIRVRPMPRHPSGPVKLWVAPWRIEPTYPGVGVKSLAYFSNMYSGLAARHSGCEEALILNTRNRIADGAASSIFLVHDGRISTPKLDQGTLAGVTRAVAIELTKKLGLVYRETTVSWKSLMAADEIFITSSLRGVIPVSKVSGVWKSKRVDKSIATQVRIEYEKEVSNDIKHYGQLR